MEMTRIIRLLFSVAIFFQTCDSVVKCRNDKGTEVDWYILYKFPQQGKTGNGLSYLYMDETTNGWRKSSKTIDSASGALGNTLKPLLDSYIKQTEGFGFLLYNDQPPPEFNTAPSSFGHSKGVVMLDKQTGVWLSHSTPKFPTYQKIKFWPNTGNQNAQTFLCVTFSYDQFKEIGLQLKYIHAYSYDHKIPTTFHQELQCVAQRDGCYPKNKPWTRQAALKSNGKRTFVSFAKYGRFADDLYSGFIAKELNQPLFVKSWGKLRDPLPTNCSIPHVYNVERVKLAGMSFDDTVDHSKWCVTADGGWTCIADMNREKSQMKRGGGAICIMDHVVGGGFKTLVAKSGTCVIPSHNSRQSRKRKTG